MTKITKEEVNKVAHLARLELNADEINHQIFWLLRRAPKYKTNKLPSKSVLK